MPLTDALGSVIALSDEAGAVGTEYTYQPFGATAGPAAPDPNPYRFTGREVDDSGLHFHRGRYYHPALQRFIAENPIGFAGGRANLYTYAQNNPLSLTDPLGVDVEPARQQSIAATALAAWDPVGGRAAPASGLRIAGLVDADMALLERVIGAWASPEQAQALDALRPTSSVERGSCTPVSARVFRSWIGRAGHGQSSEAAGGRATPMRPPLTRKLGEPGAAVGSCRALEPSPRPGHCGALFPYGYIGGRKRYHTRAIRHQTFRNLASSCGAHAF